MRPSRWYKAYFFDIDGTLALGDQIIPGVADFLQILRDRKIIIRFLSNESTTNRAQHVTRLRKAGISCEPDEVLTVVEATVRWLEFNYPDAVVFPIGAPSLTKELRQHNITISEDPSKIDIVLAASDHHLTFEKLQIAYDALYQYRRAFLMATNPDRHGPLPDHGGVPDTGAIIAAIEAATETHCQIVIGKPNPHMMLAALAEADVSPSDALMVGDTFATDIAVAHNAGTDSALTLTGDSTVSEVMRIGPPLRPTFVVENLMGLVPNEAE